MNLVLQSLVEKDEIQPISVEGLPPVFIQKDLFEKSFELTKPDIRLLSPFDNAIIHRDRIKQLFDFAFRLECYVPKEKRQYGYFCLPILFGNTFMGRVDCKAHRKDKRLELIHLHIENTAIAPELWLPSFAQSVKRFALFNGCESLQLNQVSPSKFKRIIYKALSL